MGITGESRSAWSGIVLVALVLAAGCSSGTGTDGARPDDPGPGHIHGLGINPADGELYAGAHYGVFRISAGDATRMGDLIQDTMGFTIAGPDRFLGSGHPDIRNDTILAEGDPPLLGLVESTDGGTTWQGLSLQGDADFHALTIRHDLIFGADASSGRFMVTADGQNWEHRSDISLMSLAVDPADADLVVATTPSELVRSTDGGASWTADDRWPSLVLVSWAPNAGLWGITAVGDLYRSEDRGHTWAGEGSVDAQPSAMLATDDDLYVATTDAIVRSSDHGSTWEVIYTLH